MSRSRSAWSLSKRPAAPKPALFTSTAIGRSDTARATRSAPSALARSSSTTRVCTEKVFSSSDASASSRSRRRAESATDMPSRASARANASPIPADAPVTSAHSP